MAENQQQQAQEAQLKEGQVATTGATLDQALNKLVKLGGFDFFEATIDGVQNLSPERKARKRIFLTEEDKRSERNDLKAKLKLWLNVITESETIADMAQKCNERAEATSHLMKKNLKKALDRTRELETAYRSVALFFKNTESDKVKNVGFLNANLEQVTDLDNTRFIDAVNEELKQNYDRLDLRDNYSILVIPGYLKRNSIVEKWAKIANENKVMLVTDFENYESPDDVIDMFESANLTGGEVHRSNVMMTCNWLVGRGKVADVGEEEDLYVPPSSALAGKVYRTLMSQVTAGKKHGGMNEVDAVRFDLKKSEISNLEKIGLIPMVNEYGKVMAFSAKTLFNGDNLGLQTYSVVRVFDYITKVLIDFLNRRAFENWNVKTETDLRGQIIKFLDSIKGADKLIEKFKVLRLERDPVQKDKIYLDIHITPYFPAKSFMVKLDGTKGEDSDSVEWNSEYAQQ